MILDPANGRKDVDSMDTRYDRCWNIHSPRVLSKSIFLARLLENNLTFWFTSLTAHNLCCPTQMMDWQRRVSRVERVCLDALFALSHITTMASISHVIHVYLHDKNHLMEPFVLLGSCPLFYIPLFYNHLAIVTKTVLREPKFKTEFPYFFKEKRPEFRRMRDL